MQWDVFIQAGIRLPFYMHLFVEGAQQDLPRLLGWRPERWLVCSEQQLTTVFCDPADQARFTDWFQREIIPSAERREEFLTVLRTADEELLKFCRSLYHTHIEALQAEELKKFLAEFIILFRKKFALYGAPKLVDGAAPTILATQFSRPLDAETFFELALPAHLGEYARERLMLLSIAQTARLAGLAELFTKSNAEVIEQLGRFYPKLYHQVEAYARQFAWVPVSHHVQPLSLDQALSAVRVALLDPKAAEEFNRYVDIVARSPDRVAAKLSRQAADLGDRSLIRFFCHLNEINESRKAAMSKALLWSYPLFQEIAERLGIDVVTLRQLTAPEMLEALASGSIAESARATATERLEMFACQLEMDRLEVWGGEAARAVLAREIPPVTAAQEVRGSTATPGEARGKVRVIRLEYQCEQLEEGEILVTSMTDPDMVPAMKRAAAIVTDEGGITCHAAIVSRELNKPCIVGTKIATKIFKDGDLVAVDATKGIVKKI